MAPVIASTVVGRPAAQVFAYAADYRNATGLVRGWSVREPLYISCNADRMMAKVQTAVVKAMREESLIAAS